MDTQHGTTAAEFLEIARSEGFQIFLEIPFKNNYGGVEKFYILFNKEDGILLRFDTCNGILNSGNIYYNWVPNKKDEFYPHTSTGSREGDFWAGEHSCRVGFRFKLHRLRENGKFITPWRKQPFLWLLHYQDTKNKNYDSVTINKRRMSKLPDFVRTAILAD